MNSVIVQTGAFLFFCIIFVINFCVVLACNRSTKLSIAFCKAVLAWSLFLFISTEILSMMNLINRHSIATAWIIMIVTEIAWCIRKKIPVVQIINRYLFQTKLSITETDAWTIILIIVCVFLAVRSIVVAVFTVPNNWDSMTYHLSRIVYWLEHQNVNYYFTNIPRQLYSPVFAEYINLHVMALCNGDLYVNLLQALSLCGCCFLVYSISKQIGVSNKGSLLAVLLMQSANIVIAESISTQVDILAAFFLLILTLLLIDIVENDRNCMRIPMLRFLEIGFSIGLIYITKTSVCIPAAILILGTAIVCFIRKYSFKMMLLGGWGAAISAIAVMIPSFYRNYTYVGDILASKYMGRIATGTLNPGFLFVNALKNIGSCLATKLNSALLVRIITKAAKIIGVDVNAEAISFTVPFRVDHSYDMDLAGAPLIAYLFIPTIVLSLFIFLRKKNSKSWFALLMVFQFVVMTAAVRWQPWVTRLLLPSLMLLTISIAYCGNELYRKFGFGKSGLFPAFIIAGAIVISASNSGASFAYNKEPMYENITGVKSRFDLYFARGGNVLAFRGLCDAIDKQHYETIGLYTGVDSYQYPLLARYWFAGNQIENISLEKEEKKTEEEDYSPDAIICIDRTINDDRQSIITNGAIYHCIYENSSASAFSVWEKK